MRPGDAGKRKTLQIGGTYPPANNPFTKTECV
jgi:hypothetical protein